MKKLTKKIFGISTGLLVPSTALLSSISFASNNSEDNKEGIYFKGRMFKNAEEAFIYMNQNNLIDIKTKKVIGDISRSYVDYQNGILKKDLLPDYDISKIKPAYFNAGGGIVDSYKKAKDTYYNPGTVVQKYDDGFGSADFLNERDAANSMRSKSIQSKIAYYNVDYVLPSETNLRTIKTKLNPFNKEDIKKYKENIQNNINSIIYDNLTNSDPTYKIVVNNKSSLISTPKVSEKEFFANIFKNSRKISNFDYDILTKSQSDDDLFRIKYNNCITSKLESGWSGIGDWKWNDSSNRNWQNKTSNPISYTIQNHDTRWTWTGSNNRSFKGDDPKYSFLNFVNGTNDSWIKTSDEDRVSEYSLNEQMIKKEIKSLLYKYVDNIKNQDLKTIFKDYPALKKDNILSKFVFSAIRENARKNIESLKDNDFSKKYSIKNLPNFSVEARNSGGFGVDNDVKVNKNNYKFNYSYYLGLKNREKDIKIDLEEIFQNNLLSKLLSWKASDKNSAPKFTIVKNGHNLFDITLSSNNGHIIIKDKDIKVNEKNQDGAFVKPTTQEVLLYKTLKTKDQLNTVKEPSKYLYWVLDEFYKDIFKAKQDYKNKDVELLSEIQRFFKEYLDNPSKYYGLVKNDLRFKKDFQFDKIKLSNKEEITPFDSIKLYWLTIQETYKKYKDQKELLKIVSSNIISPKEIFAYYNKDENKKTNSIFGKYIMKNISQFNTSLSSGIFNNKLSPLASNAEEWARISKDVKYVPSRLLIAYDNNGKPINVGGYKYDNSTLLEFNAKLNVKPRRDYDHVFIDGQIGAIKNEVTTIYTININGIDIYFLTFNNVKQYMLKYIKENSVKI